MLGRARRRPPGALEWEATVASAESFGSSIWGGVEAKAEAVDLAEAEPRGQVAHLPSWAACSKKWRSSHGGDLFLLSAIKESMRLLHFSWGIPELNRPVLTSRPGSRHLSLSGVTTGHVNLGIKCFTEVAIIWPSSPSSLCDETATGNGWSPMVPCRETGRCGSEQMHASSLPPGALVLSQPLCPRSSWWGLALAELLHLCQGLHCHLGQLRRPFLTPFPRLTVTHPDLWKETVFTKVSVSEFTDHLVRISVQRNQAPAVYL